MHVLSHELFGEMHGPKPQEEYPKDRIVPDTVTITVLKQGTKTTITRNTDDSLLQILKKIKLLHHPTAEVVNVAGVIPVSS